jgi:glycerol-3-phosphate dehydrogenase (NAD(P)+)
VDAPVTSALARLIEGSLPLDDWVSLVRARQPAPARFGGNRLRRLFARRRRRRNIR